MRNWQFVIGLIVSLAFTACDARHPSATASDRAPAESIVATYSIVAFDPATGDLGVSVQSKFFGVGSVVPWAKSGVGAIATQASANVTYGPQGLKLLEEGKDAGQVIKLLTAADDGRDVRQCGIVDAEGRSATFTGTACNAFAGGRTGKHFAVQGNILASAKVIEAMAEAYEAAQQKQGSELADWLVAALQAGEDAGGDSRGRQSAALLVVRDKGGYGRANDRYIDLRVEDHPDPTRDLSRLLELHKGFYPKLHLLRPKRSQ
jgi:uncharacterized Ntn-hydrolase superfamily protein